MTDIPTEPPSNKKPRPRSKDWVFSSVTRIFIVLSGLNIVAHLDFVITLSQSLRFLISTWDNFISLVLKFLQIDLNVVNRNLITIFITVILSALIGHYYRYKTFLIFDMVMVFSSGKDKYYDRIGLGGLNKIDHIEEILKIRGPLIKICSFLSETIFFVIGLVNANSLFGIFAILFAILNSVGRFTNIYEKIFKKIADAKIYRRIKLLLIAIYIFIILISNIIPILIFSILLPFFQHYKTIIISIGWIFLILSIDQLLQISTPAVNKIKIEMEK